MLLGHLMTYSRTASVTHMYATHTPSMPSTQRARLEMGTTFTCVRLRPCTSGARTHEPRSRTTTEGKQQALTRGRNSLCPATCLPAQRKQRSGAPKPLSTPSVQHASGCASGRREEGAGEQVERYWAKQSGARARVKAAMADPGLRDGNKKARNLSPLAVLRSTPPASRALSEHHPKTRGRLAGLRGRPQRWRVQGLSRPPTRRRKASRAHLSPPRRKRSCKHIAAPPHQPNARQRRRRPNLSKHIGRMLRASAPRDPDPSTSRARAFPNKILVPTRKPSPAQFSPTSTTTVTDVLRCPPKYNGVLRPRSRPTTMSWWARRYQSIGEADSQWLQ